METSDVITARVREKLGEVIPDGGTEADTLFTDNQIKVWTLNSLTFNHIMVEAWEAKLGAVSDLVDVTDGASSRRMATLAERAEANLRYYRQRVAAGPDDGLNRTRTRVGKIVRRG